MEHSVIFKFLLYFSILNSLWIFFYGLYLFAWQLSFHLSLPLGTLLEAFRVCLIFQHTDHFMTFPIPGQRKPTLLWCFSICAVGSPSFLDSSLPLRGSGLMCGGRRKPTRFLLRDCPSGLERLFSPKLNTEVYCKYVFFRGHFTVLIKSGFGKTRISDVTLPVSPVVFIPGDHLP